VYLSVIIRHITLIPNLSRSKNFVLRSFRSLSINGIWAFQDPTQYTMPGTRQQNDIAERRNKTLMDMIRSILSNSIVPISLWMYALKTIMYLLNQISSKAVERTPFELWMGRKRSLRHIHV
jgi:transposase InsO family protein